MTQGIDKRLLIMTITTIMLNHVGLERRISRKELWVLLRIYFPELTDRMMRKTIEEDCERVCSSLGGYYIAATKQEVDKADEFLRSYIKAASKRISRRWRAYPEFYGEQIDLPILYARQENDGKHIFVNMKKALEEKP